MNNNNQTKTGLWKTQSKNGAEYYTGKVEIKEPGTYRIAMFINNNKLSEKSPDYNLSFSVSNGTQQTTQATQGIQSIRQDEIKVELDDLPF